jgi:phosphoglucosamine mutase
MAGLKKVGRKKAIGGEPSGHMLFPDILMAGDGLICALIILEMCVNNNKTIEKITKHITRWPSILVNVPEEIPSCETMTDKCRVLIRRSGTEPVTRIYIEGETKQDCENMLEQILKQNHI